MYRNIKVLLPTTKSMLLYWWHHFQAMPWMMMVNNNNVPVQNWFWCKKWSHQKIYIKIKNGKKSCHIKNWIKLHIIISRFNQLRLDLLYKNNYYSGLYLKVLIFLQIMYSYIFCNKIEVIIFLSGGNNFNNPLKYILFYT